MAAASRLLVDDLAAAAPAGKTDPWKDGVAPVPG
jgi:hypothetical protein